MTQLWANIKCFWFGHKPQDETSMGMIFHICKRCGNVVPARRNIMGQW